MNRIYPDSWLLAIDTSSGMAGVAALSGERIVSRNWESDRAQTQTLAPVVDTVMAELGVGLADLGALAVSTGPGSFTGLRVGMAFAKGLATFGDLPIVGIPTLDLIAWPLAQRGGDGIAVIPAGRGRVVWSSFMANGTLGPATNSTFDDFRNLCAGQPGTLVAGEMLVEQRTILEADGVHLSLFAQLSRVEVLAHLGRERWQHGDVDDLASLVPRYLHGNPNPRQVRDGGLSSPRG